MFCFNVNLKFSQHISVVVSLRALTHNLNYSLLIMSFAHSDYTIDKANKNIFRVKKLHLRAPSANFLNFSNITTMSILLSLLSNFCYFCFKIFCNNFKAFSYSVNLIGYPFFYLAYDFYLNK